MPNILDTAITTTVTTYSVGPPTLTQTQKNYIRATNGNLYAAVHLNDGVGKVFQSVNNGYSWEIAPNVMFPEGWYQFNYGYPKRSTTLVWDQNNDTYGRFLIGGDYQGTTNDWTFASLNFNQTYDEQPYYWYNYSYWGDWFLFDEIPKNGASNFIFSKDYGGYMIYVDEVTSKIEILYVNCDPGNGPYAINGVQMIGTYSGTQTFESIYDSTLYSNYIYTAIASISGSNDRLLANAYNMTTTATGGWKTVDSTDYALINDIGIDTDGYGKIGVVYTTCPNSTTAELRYAQSYDGGTSWVKQSIVAPSGTTAFTDKGTQTAQTHAEVLGTYEKGFLIAATYVNSTSTPCTYVNNYLTTTGASGTYSWQGWQQINSNTALPSVGGHFFRQEYHNGKQFAGQFQDIRYVYQYGSEPASGSYSNPSTTSVNQERLTNNAYPIAPSGTNYFDYFVDYKALGYTGSYTTKADTAFNKVATNMTLKRYEPNPLATSVGISAYKAPILETVKAVLDPNTYDGLPETIPVEDFTTAVERDIRTAFFDSDTYLQRTVVQNAIGNIRRTVYTLQFAGKEYEITQVVPHVMYNQICYYRANAFVVGTNNDPWTKATPPSET